MSCVKRNADKAAKKEPSAPLLRFQYWCQSANEVKMPTAKLLPPVQPWKLSQSPGNEKLEVHRPIDLNNVPKENQVKPAGITILIVSIKHKGTNPGKKAILIPLS